MNTKVTINRLRTGAPGMDEVLGGGLPELVEEVTTFLIGEYFVEADTNPVFTVANGLLWLSQSVMRNSVVRKLEVMKMRGQATWRGCTPFALTTAARASSYCCRGSRRPV